MTLPTTLPTVEQQREALRTTTIEAPHKHRVLFLGNLSRGVTDIVPSLMRALENVGHTVFALDIANFKGLLDNPTDAKGGYGPIFVDVRAISAILHTFRPEVLVLCAGGMVLSEDSAAALRERGIVTVGVTLSDPDVQPSVIDHVGNFDYHTTNAKLALTRYHEAGIRNTFLMPFGIDRDFILRDVAPNPAMRADAICIGHAPGRLDRHEVMLELAKYVDVKVYGNGWPFPGSGPVSGDQLLQAAREGTIHVNFPATRAGFTNVKCGVFETIGTGSVLATTEFDEMGELFAYGEEIIGYAGAKDLAATIHGLKQDPERLERIRRQGFHRLVTEHLYEHRWLKLFADIEADVASDDPLVGAERAAQIREVLSTEHPRPRVVLISGYYGARNRGDDILLSALAGRIERDVPGAHVVVAAANARVVERTQGRPAFTRVNAHQADYWASRASSVVVGPGGLWHDYTIGVANGVAGIVTGAKVSPGHLVQLPTMVRAYGGTYHVYGMGVGPLTDPAAQATVRFSGLLAESVVVRDTTSADLLAAIPGFPAEVEVSPDVAYSLTLPDVDPHVHEHGDYLVVNVRPWDPTPEVAAITLEAARIVASERGLRVVAMPMQPVDELETRVWMAAHGVDDTWSILPQDASDEAFLSVLAGAEAVVAMRLHTNLIAHRLGRPCVGVAYDPKVAEHFKELGRGDFAHDLPVTTEWITDRLRAALDENVLPDAALEQVRRNEEAADASLATLTKRLADGPLRTSIPGVLPQAPPQERPPLTVWEPNEIVALSQAVVVGGNLRDPHREVAVTRRTRHTDRFGIDASGPRAGDHATWTMTLPVQPGKGQRFELFVHNKYPERRSRRGRLAYRVLVDGHALFQHDVATWRPRNTVWFATVPTSDTLRIEVQLVALRDLPEWNWGRAATVVVEGLRQRDWSAPKRFSGIRWGASSPFAKPLGPASFLRLDTLRTGLPERLRHTAGKAARAARHVARPAD